MTSTINLLTVLFFIYHTNIANYSILFCCQNYHYLKVRSESQIYYKTISALILFDIIEQKIVNETYVQEVSMISIILVSHSKKITDGLKEMIEEMVDSTGDVKIYSAGGTEDGRLGTDSVAIYNIIEQSKDHKNILIFADIGSAILSTETAIDLIEDEALRSKVTLVDAPLVEGAFVASIQAMVDEDVEGILAELQNI